VLAGVIPKGTMNRSEKLFQEIFERFQIKFEKIPESTVNDEKRPDFEVGEGNTLSYWEVKELEENHHEKRIVKAISNGQKKIYSVNSKRVKESIRKAFHQFESYGVEESPCIVVLHDARDFMVKDFLFHQYIQSAMLGNAQFIEDQEGDLKEIYRSEGLLTNKRKYVAAIATMHAETKEIVLFHNPNSEHSLDNHGILGMFKHQYHAQNTDNGLAWIKI